MDRRHWSRSISQLDPARDYEQIYRILATHEFPWDEGALAVSEAMIRCLTPSATAGRPAGNGSWPPGHCACAR